MTQNRQLEEAAEKAGMALNALAEALSGEARRSGEMRLSGEMRGTEKEETAAPQVTFTPTKTMREAAAIAASRCPSWRIEGDTDGTLIGPAELRYACEEQDLRITFREEESGKYYLVLPDGSIGVTVNGGAEIEWIFRPA